jgi:hypothetical protein
MKRSVEALVMIELVAVIVAMAILGLCGVARAQPVQQFSLSAATPRPGDVGVHLTLRSFDTTGAVLPARTEWTIRLPRGFSLDRSFLNARWLCDGRALRAALDARPTGQPFTQRLTDLKPLIRELGGSRATRHRAALANARACERGRLGGGVGVIDARNVLPLLNDPIPFVFSLFLSRGTIPGAIAGFTAIGAADPRSTIVGKFPVLAGVHAVVTENVVSDPTPDGLYGDKVVLDSGPINGFHVSIAEVHASLRSLRMRKGTCIASAGSGRCTHRLRTDVSLFQIPACPPSGHLSAQLFTAFPPPMPSLTTTLQVPCPRFVS